MLSLRMVGFQSMGAGLSLAAVKSWWNGVFGSRHVCYRHRNAMRHVGRICKFWISQRLLRTQALLYHVSSLRGGAYVLLRTCAYTFAASGPWPTDGVFRHRILHRLFYCHVGNR